jgi:uncharacterized protein YukE
MTYVNPIPATYDASSLDIDPAALGSAAQSVLASVKDISSYLTTINNKLSSLTLSWAGSSAQKAQDFNDEWTNAVQALFGTQGDPDSGALSKLVDALSTAAQNYSQNEANIQGMFNKFASGFSPSSSSSSSSSTKPPSTIDSPTDLIDGGPEALYHTTSVNERF